jgi:bZIP transcription factor
MPSRNADGPTAAVGSASNGVSNTSFDLQELGQSGPSAVAHGFSSMLFRGPQPKPGGRNGQSGAGSMNADAGSSGGPGAGADWLRSMQRATGQMGGTENGGFVGAEAYGEADFASDDDEPGEEEASAATASKAKRGARGKGKGKGKASGTGRKTKKADLAKDPKTAAQYAVHRNIAQAKEKQKSGTVQDASVDLTEDNASFSQALGGTSGGNDLNGTAGAASEDADPATVRKAQNRIAQREFRQRKQEYIRALECRVELLSTDHDTQVDRLRWLLRQLLIENNQLRSVVGLMCSFIGDQGMGGVLGNNPAIRTELSELLTSTSEKTVTDAWREFVVGLSQLGDY